MSTNRDNNYSDILRLRSHEFYSNVFSNQRPSPTTTIGTTVGTTAERQSHQWLQMSSNFQPILRSNSSLSLDQKRFNQFNNTLVSNSNSIDFKDFQELRECRFGNDRTTLVTTPKTTAPTTRAKSRTISSVHALSVSNENLNSNKMKTKKKSFFKQKEKNIENGLPFDVKREEYDRRRRLRQLFIHYDIQSAQSLDELFDDTETTEVTTPDDEEDDTNSNSLLAFSANFRNEVAKEDVFCLQLNRENSETESLLATETTPRRPARRSPIHTTTLSRQLSCLSSFDMSSDPTQAALLSLTECPFARESAFTNCLETDFGSGYYRKYFFGFSHQNVLHVHEKNAFALSLRKDSKDFKKLRVILRTNHSLKALRGFLNLNHHDLNARALFDLLLPRVWTRDALVNAKIGMDAKSDEILVKFDELLENCFFKIGILYSRDSQQTEEDFYNNKEVFDKDFDEFLSIVGTRIRLKGYKGFRGGLDVTTDTTGLFTFATHFDNNEIIYHVMNELPFTANNRQQLLRKRHIGNDIVTIIFQNKHFRGKPFSPSTIRSHFQHVFLIVRPHHNGYRVAVARHRDVPAFGPPLKPFYRKEELRDFLLTKVINAENACHKCAKFKQMALRTRFEYLNDLYMNYTTQTTVSSLLSSSLNQSFPVSSVSSTQQLIQFSQNFNKYFSQIFQKSEKRKTQNDVSSEVSSKSGNIFLENELLFGSKVYESVDDSGDDLSCGRPVVRSSLRCHSYQQSLDLKEIKVLLSQNFLLVVNTKRVFFALPLDHVIGFGLTNPDSRDSTTIEIQFRIYFHFGELILLKESLMTSSRDGAVVGDAESIHALIETNSLLFELKTDLMTKVADLDLGLGDHLRSRQTKEVVLRRNPMSADQSFGFHVQSRTLATDHFCVYVTEANEHALRVNGLTRGQRLLELCHIPIVALSYDQILDFLRTSLSVSVSLIQPLPDGQPRVNSARCRHVSSKNDLRKSLKTFGNDFSRDYENIGTTSVGTTLMTTVGTTRHDNAKTPPKTSSPLNSVYDRTRQMTTNSTTNSTTSHSQRPLHLKTNQININLSSQSSTTSSTLQEDLIKLITLDDTSLVENDSHSSSRYSTATSTPYSSLERRQQTTDGRQTDDCVLTVAKPAFVVNNEILDSNSNVEREGEGEWRSLVGEEEDGELRSQVVELSREKQRLNETIRKLKEENQRLHFESQTASQQLRKFTQWFFSSNNNHQ